MRDSTHALVRLRRRLERIEPRRAPAREDVFATGHEAIDHVLGGGLARGRLHELFAGEEDAGSGAGAAALLGLRAGSVEGNGAPRPFLWLRSEAAEKRSGRLYATGLSELGIDPAAFLLALMPDDAALLHAAAEAARCGGLGALLIECRGTVRGLDLIASRRLMLAAEASGVTVLLLRIAAQPVPSAADTRWRVAAAPSAVLEAAAPGAPMFELELLRRRAGPPAGPWRVEWDRDRSCFREPCDELVPSSLVRPESPLPRPVLPVAARGAPVPHLPADFRRTG